MLIYFDGPEYAVVNRIAYKCEYLLDPKKENRKRKVRRKKIHDPEEVIVKRK